MNTQNSDRLDAYIDGILPESEIKHLTDEERAFAEDYKRIMNGLDDNVSVPLDIQAAWRKAVRAEAAGKKKSFKRTMLRTASAVAAAIIVLAGATGIMRGNGMLIQNETGKSAYRYVNTGASFASIEKESAEVPLSVASDGEAFEPAAEDSAVSLDAADVYEEAADLASAKSENSALPSPYATIDPENEAVMLARSAEYTAKTDDIESDLSLIDELIAENDGYPEIRDTQRSAAYVTARIPASGLDDFLDSLKNIGETMRLIEHSINIKENYYDAGSRLDSLEAEHARLLDLIGTADASKLASLREEFENVTSRIDTLKSEIAGWEHDAAYAKVEISLYTDEESPAATPRPDLGERVSRGFGSSAESVKEFLQDMLVALSVIAPAALAVLPVIIVIVVICVAVKKRKEKSK